jgi:hypothetical protein
MIDHIRDVTNVYALEKQGKAFIPVSSHEIEQYIGILFHMEIVAMPDFKMYWTE